MPFAFGRLYFRGMPEEQERVRRDEPAAKPRFDDYSRPEAERTGEPPRVAPMETAEPAAAASPRSRWRWPSLSVEDYATCGVVLGLAAAFQGSLWWASDGKVNLPAIQWSLAGLGLIGFIRWLITGSLRPPPPELQQREAFGANLVRIRRDLVFSGAGLAILGIVNAAYSIVTQGSPERGIRASGIGAALFAIGAVWTKLSKKEPLETKTPEGRSPRGSRSS